MKTRKYTDEQFKEAVASSHSIRQVLSKIGLVPIGGSYRTANKLIKTLCLDTSHFTGQLWNKGKTFAPKRVVEEYLSNSKPIASYKLKIRLIKDQILSPICHHCKTVTWMDKPIPLELDHIDGNHCNNNLSNLRLLCPNCHAQTPTHAGKNKGKGTYRSS